MHRLGDHSALLLRETGTKLAARADPVASELPTMEVLRQALDIAIGVLRRDDDAVVGVLLGSPAHAQCSGTPGHYHS